MPKAEDEDIIRLRHMLDAASKALELTESCNRDELDKDEKLALALVRLLEVLGEAARRVSDHCRQMYPKIPWRQIAGTRNRLIHGYFDVDLDIVWRIISTDLPPLVQQLETALSNQK